VWLRNQEPDASVETQMVATSEDDVVCRATITLQSGGTATAHGSANRTESERAVEEAESRALGRALAALGFGAEYADDDVIEIQPSPEPPLNLMTARALLERPRIEFEAQEEDEPEAELEEPEPTSTSAPAPVPASQLTSDGERPDATDISWTKFWAWAKPRGYGSAVELGELLGVDVLAHTPGEIRRLIKRYELEHPPGDPGF
ncbi:MAG: hypothetical protein ACREH3_16905, partial [Geminicoccales bacterium]